MPADVNAQLIQFLACIISGAAIGILYNLFAAIRKVFSFGRTATFFTDVIFWLAGTVVFFCILIVCCNGEITWYGFVGVILGLVLYLVTISKILYPLLLYTVRLIKRFLLLFLRLFLKPICKTARFMCRLFMPVKNLAQNTRKKTTNFVKNNVEKIRRISILLRKI